MPIYCVNRNVQPVSGHHEVHDVGVGSRLRCMPEPDNQVDLGWHPSCHDALLAAKQRFADVNGCAYCAPDCHTT